MINNVVKTNKGCVIMNDEPGYVVEWQVESKYVATKETTTQCIKVDSLKSAQEVASNIREDASFKDTSLGQVWNYVNYIRVYKLSDPVEL